MRNKHVKSHTKTMIKKLTLAANAGQKDDLQALFIQAVSAIDKAAAKGVYHKNTASRKKSQLAKLMNKAV
jgi:small subunit ribosomal protein S20